MSFYDFTAVKMSGQEVDMQDYKGKVVIVVNTASKCGLTPQFAGLEALYTTYKDQGLEILGFPTNQFGHGDAAENESIESFCQLNYGVTFTMFQKIKVNGGDTHPLFKFLKHEAKGTIGSAIKWNFTKFLIARDGKPIARYGSATKPENLELNARELSDLIHHSASENILVDLAIEGDADQGGGAAGDRAQRPRAELERAVQPDLHLLRRSRDFPRVRPPEPVVRLLPLPAVLYGLAEDAVLVTDAVPDRGNLERRERVEVARGEAAEAPVPEPGVRFLFDEFVEIDPQLGEDRLGGQGAVEEVAEDVAPGGFAGVGPRCVLRDA